MNQYICFYEDYKEFISGVKYKIKSVTDKHYIVRKCKVPKGRKDLYEIKEVIY